MKFNMREEMLDGSIEINNISKAYCRTLKKNDYPTLRDDFLSLFSLRTDKRSDQVLKAVDDISVSIKSGEVVGLIGQNGAGKSTLLRVLAGITRPTKGSFSCKGRIASLLELGAGFHPELSGRDNIYLNASILGMKRSEVKSKFNDIVSFSGIEDFIDTPVKFYSSGMYIRLAFAVAAHVEPDILLVDEILAVGDANFQSKCINKIIELASADRTVVFVSHNMAAVQRLCNRTLVLDKGKLIADMETGRAISYYYSEVVEPSIRTTLSKRTDRGGTGDVLLHDIWIEDIGSNRIYNLYSGQDVEFCFLLNVKKPVKDLCISFGVHGSLGENLLNCVTEANGINYSFEKAGVYTVRCKCPKLPLASGKYKVGVVLSSANVNHDLPGYCMELSVSQGDFWGSGYVEKNSPLLVHYEWDKGSARGDNV